LETTILIGSNHAGAAWCWNFSHYGRTYSKPTVNIIDGGYFLSACTDQARSPYYCGQDQRMVLPKSFFRKYDRAETLVVTYTIVAHEHAHHAQQLLGLKNRMTNRELELQADCAAGWMYGLWEDDDKDTTEDLFSAVNIMFLSGDDGHGSGKDRFLAFMRGYYQVNDHATDGGWGACIPEQDWR
jgi:predicted metalloprotease